MTSLIQYQRQGAIATLAFNRPEKLNALDIDAIEGFGKLAAEAARDTEARALIVRGNGGHFCAGGDVQVFAEQLERFKHDVPRVAGILHEGIMALREAPFPVIASVEGACAGAGFSIMLACDLAIASENAKFSVAYTAIGTSSDGGASWSLPRIVGMRKALELMLLSERITAQRAYELNLVNFIVPPAELESATHLLASRLAAGPTQAYKSIKQLANGSFSNTLADQLAAEVDGFARCAATADFAEGTTAFVAKRTPHFTGKA